MGDRFTFLRLSPIQTWGGAFVLYASLSLLWSPGSWWAGVQLASLVVAFVIGALAPGLRLVWASAILVLLATLALIPWMPYGIYGNQNYLGCALALAIAGALAYRVWPALPFLGAGLLYTGSRGAIVATGATFGIALWRWSRMVAIPVFLIAVVIAFSLSPGRDNSLLARAGIWEDTVLHATLFGSGWGSFYDMYWHFPIHISPTEHMTGVRAEHAYNDFLELVFDLGIGSIPLWVLILLCMEGTDPRQRLIIWTFLALGLTFFPLYIFPLGQAFAMSLGHLSRSRQLEMPQWHAIASKTSTI